MLFGIIKRQKGRGILRGRSGVIWTKDRAAIVQLEIHKRVYQVCNKNIW